MHLSATLNSFLVPAEYTEGFWHQQKFPPLPLRENQVPFFPLGPVGGQTQARMQLVRVDLLTLLVTSPLVFKSQSYHWDQFKKKGGMAR